MKYIWQLKDWPHFTWHDQEILKIIGKARFEQGKLLSKLETIGINKFQESQAEILIEEAVKTSEIEGHLLNRESVRSSVIRRLGLIPDENTAPLDRYAEGLLDLINDATANFKECLTSIRLQSWQRALFPTGYSGLRKIYTKGWRQSKEPMQVVSGPVGKEKVHFEAPPSNKINSEIKKFLSWFENDSKETDGLLRAGIAHLWFVTIHPFDDGNGRIARALCDMALAQDENMSNRFYSLSSVIMSNRNSYYQILESSQKGTLDITPWLIWFCEIFIKAVKNAEDLIENILLKSKFWQKHYQTELNDRQKKVINRLLDKGPGGFEGGLTTKKYVAMTKASRATAFREISDLQEKGILIQTNSSGRNVSYDINWNI
ncbi:MAG: hypothetical protein ACD_79C00404G0001, partial [uncultured bacterium]